jgi:polyribonucleotide nucleotidyltransferase
LISAFWSEALEQAREGRMYIMSKMLEALPSPREAMSEFAPRILTVNIDPEKIGQLIGPGGKTIRGLQDNFEVKIDVEEDGTVFVSGCRRRRRACS